VSTATRSYPGEGSAPRLWAAGRGRVVPYITAWSVEKMVYSEVIERRGFGIAFADESVLDRDRDGVLWTRRAVGRGVGRPEFGVVHSLRQRRPMGRLLCQVCAQPADRNEDGVLWLLPDYYRKAPGWPENYDLAEPPICLACVPVAIRLCPTAVSRSCCEAENGEGPLGSAAGPPGGFGDVSASGQS
jgi:hypothetical protein